MPRPLVIILSLLLSIVTGDSQTLNLTQDQLTTETYNPAAILRTANKLISSGDEITYQSLLTYSKSSEVDPWGERDNYVTWLCLLVYNPRPHHVFKVPVFGAPDFPTGAENFSSTWPKFPLAFERDIPFLLVSGYTLAGLAWPGSYYVEDCHKNGVLRAKLYRVPSKKDAEAALKEFLTSPHWKTLDWPANSNDTGSENEKIKFIQAQVDRVSP